MTTPASPANTFRCSPALVALHGFMALLFVAVYATIELRVLFPKGTDTRELMKALHFMLGLGVLLMVLARLGARWFSPKPQQGPTPGLQTWMHRMAALGHHCVMKDSLLARMSVLRRPMAA